MIRVLFVCLGNICRSPSGEAVFKALIENEGLTDKFFIDSAGTSAFHAGERADNRMRKHAEKRGIELTSRSRQFVPNDFEDFDYILAMDETNFNEIKRIDHQGSYLKKVTLMTEFSKSYFKQDVPDPYYGGGDGFEEVLDILEESCRGLLTVIKDNERF